MKHPVCNMSGMSYYGQLVNNVFFFCGLKSNGFSFKVAYNSKAFAVVSNCQNTVLGLVILYCCQIFVTRKESNRYSIWVKGEKK